MPTDLVEQIYDAAVEVELWPDVLAGIAGACGAVSATLVSGQNLPGLAISPGVEESQAAYAAHWWQHDIVAQAIFASPRDGLFCDWQLIDEACRARHPFYQEFRRSFGLRDNVTFTAGARADFWFGLSLQMPLTAAEQPDAAALATFGDLGRHVRRSLQVTRRIRATQAPGSAEAVYALACGVACLDGRGRVLLANPALQGFATDGLAVSGGRLRAADAASQDALDGLVRQALDPWGRRGPALVAISRPSRKRNLLVSILPLPDRRAWALLAGQVPHCRAVITVVDPDAEAPRSLEQALEALSLSPAEARLAALVGRSLSPREAAEALGVTEGTVRTRLKQVFDKLGVSRQSELARLVTQLSTFRG